MTFKEKYQEKLVTVNQAVDQVKDGYYIDLGWATSYSIYFENALAKRITEFSDLHLRGGCELKEPDVFAADPENKHFDYTCFHGLGPMRKVFASHQAYYAPMKYSELPSYYKRGYLKTNIYVLQAAPMDEHGFFNFGLATSHIRTQFESADIVIVEVNEKMPIISPGIDSVIHIDEVDFVIEGDNPEIRGIPVIGAGGEAEAAVAKYVVDLIEDGSTLQIGVGNLPSAIVQGIVKSDLKDLGCHTELFVDGFVDLIEAGKVTGMRKNIDRGSHVYTFGMGSPRMYEFMSNNPQVIAKPVDYVNSPSVVNQIDKFVSINGAIQIDLHGVSSAESVGTRHISGSGGALDFMLGGYESKNGKSFVTLMSAREDRDGNLVSNIVPSFEPGTQVTAVRANTHYIATEQGVFNFKGKSVWERAEGVISLAHPKFRDELIKEAEKMGIWKKSNK